MGLGEGVEEKEAYGDAREGVLPVAGGVTGRGFAVGCRLDAEFRRQGTPFLETDRCFFTPFTFG